MPFWRSQYWHLDIHPVKGSHRSSWGPPIPDTISPHIQQSTFMCISWGTACWEHVQEWDSFKNYAIRAMYMAKGHIIYIITNLICLMSCEVCGVPCIGETKTTLKRQFHDQRSTVNARKSDTPVGHHFGLPNHSILDMILQGIEPPGTTESLSISVERRCIDQMASLHSTHGLNIQSIGQCRAGSIARLFRATSGACCL